MRTTLIATGGTIAWRGRDQQMVRAEELLGAARETATEVVDVAAAPSWDLSVTDIVAISCAVNQAVDDGSTAVVVTHGTDTMEESAWLCELLLGSARRGRASIVFTGAMRFLDDADTDGPGNLAVRGRRWSRHRRSAA